MGEVKYELPNVVEIATDDDSDDDAPDPFDVRELLRSNSSLDEAEFNKKKAVRKSFEIILKNI